MSLQLQSGDVLRTLATADWDQAVLAVQMGDPDSAAAPPPARDSKRSVPDESRGGFVLRAHSEPPVRRRSLSERSIAVKRTILQVSPPASLLDFLMFHRPTGWSKSPDTLTVPVTLCNFAGSAP